MPEDAPNYRTNPETTVAELMQRRPFQNDTKRYGEGPVLGAKCPPFVHREVQKLLESRRISYYETKSDIILDALYIALPIIKLRAGLDAEAWPEVYIHQRAISMNQAAKDRQRRDEDFLNQLRELEYSGVSQSQIMSIAEQYLDSIKEPKRRERLAQEPVIRMLKVEQLMTPDEDEPKPATRRRQAYEHPRGG